MNDYRRGTVLGLTVAETFILLTFLLLIALLGLIQPDEPPAEPDTLGAPGVWVPPDEIETLKNAATAARKAEEAAKQARAAAERERDLAHEKATEARKAEEAAKQARASAERERDRAQERAEKALQAEEKAERDRDAAERGRDEAQEEAIEAQMAREKAERDRDAAERERDKAQEEATEAQGNLALLRRKGENPPCWYQEVPAGKGKTREKPYYVFNAAIYEDSIEMAPRTAPPGGAFDDGGDPYADEWKRLRIEELPYGKRLSDNEFIEAVRALVAQGRNRQVRTYECVFSVMVWDKTPDHAKKRWKDAHDRIIESSFSAYTVRDLEWKGVE